MSTMKRNVILVLVASIVLLLNYQSINAEVPKILSMQGDDAPFLPDFSYAGYYWGEKPIPDLPATLNAVDFGVVPDDGKDDTKALQKAMKAAHQQDGTVVLRLPAGKIIVREILYIEKSNFVLQGAGSGVDGTLLYFPIPLNDLPLPDGMEELDEYLKVNNKVQKIKDMNVEVPFSLYAWTGGFIWTRVKGKRIKPYMDKYNEPFNELAKIVSGKRGEHKITVDNTENLKIGEIISIHWYNKEGENGSLIDHMYNTREVFIGSRHWDNPDYPLVTQEVTITKITGNEIEIKSPLMHDLRPEWHPVIVEWQHLEEVGIEHLRIGFPYDLYNAHHVADGYSAIFLTGLAHSWVKNIKVNNGDNCILTEDCANVTIEEVETTGRTFHYSLEFGTVYNMLCKKITVNAPSIHSLSCNTGTRRSVFTDCDVNVQPTLDQHSGANMQNLFDNIRIIEKEPFHSFITGGGAKYWKPSHGAFSTLWNIQVDFQYPHFSDDPVLIKGIKDGPYARLVGINANYPVKIEYGPNVYKEFINEPLNTVPSLYEYQLKKRMQ